MVYSHSGMGQRLQEGDGLKPCLCKVYIGLPLLSINSVNHGNFAI